jgi:hypothetical protein
VHERMVKKGHIVVKIEKVHWNLMRLGQNQIWNLIVTIIP